MPPAPGAAGRGHVAQAKQRCAQPRGERARYAVCWGGSSPKKGFDCSGLVKYAFNDVADVDLPRTSNAMAQGQGVKVAKSDLKPGDLIFFNIKSRRVNHVAIYLGNDRFIHAPRPASG
jgi:cell wall-associated NlpC family hydrolase